MSALVAPTDPLPTGDDKRRAVREMFDRIAPRYDLVNRLMTVGLDRGWRGAALDAIGVGAGDRVVDVGCGTGDLTELAARRGASALGVDLAGEMLAVARDRLRPTSPGRTAELVLGDATALPVATGSVTAVVSAFALRNVVSVPPVLREMARVLGPGGRVAILEVDRPDSPILRRGHALYFERVVPRIGALVSDRAAYAYLPRSVVYLPDDLGAALEEAGFASPVKRRFLLGAAQLWTATIPGSSGR